ncbi:outer membrane protein [Aquamicrobium defluvii]|uniref:Membrane protein n=1 Tax=Aquamicrobium defluvii TaxID=69279 RepID=A0A011VJW9_9HYPH|nr:outer membrane protein [Aquamicrobium defluvii]EXL08760.1 membrane protein [Aquamicrobium defluvii]EZQ15147.1 membrane protein [Halopseudomonas bauzanensis]TDR35493.1 outer membrane immunogenic protein [Aquamicrobium defluvii]
MTTKLKFARPAAAALGILAFAASVPAFAADVVMEEPPAPAPIAELPVASWAGPYAGVNLGYGFSGRVKEPGNSISTDGFLGGAFVGYNHQMDNFVIGAEGDIGYNGIKGDNAGTKAKAGVEGSLRARLGYAISPDILLYGTAGGAAQSLKVTEGGVSDRNTMLGWTAGVGSDIKFTDNVFGRVEYRYTDYGKESFTTGGGTRDVDSRDHRINFGVGMKF